RFQQSCLRSAVFGFEPCIRQLFDKVGIRAFFSRMLRAAKGRISQCLKPGPKGGKPVKKLKPLKKPGISDCPLDCNPLNLKMNAMSWSEMKGYPQRDAPRPADSIPARQPPDTAGKGRLKTARCLNPGRTKRGRKMPSRLRIKAGLSFETALEMMGQPHSIFRSHGCSDGAGEDSGRGTCYCLLLPTGSAFGGRPICRFETAYPCGLPATQRTLRLPQD
ncbi:hypothetical protein, partial [Neisseria musculi]|uniref:hypothetical protein n=1 Tax=Neisseria musculi TaxID=1815583 RepID=UPI00360AC3A2